MVDAAPNTLTRGHKKKARTRQLLLDTALQAVSEQGEAFNVAEIAARAGVSHGTFYNYFSDRQALIEALIPAVVAAFAAQSATDLEASDPATRFAAVSGRALTAAAERPDIVRAVLRIDAIQHALLQGGALRFLAEDIEAGYLNGQFTAPPNEATLDVVVGALLQAARRIVDGHTSLEYRSQVIAQLLMSLGVSRTKAAKRASTAFAVS